MENKVNYYQQIADNALILSHRLSEYSSHGPFLEEDLANTNVALDLIGVAESIYMELARIEGVENYDNYAYKRKESLFRNCILVEQPNLDFAQIMVRQFFMDNFSFYFYSKLTSSKDSFLEALAVKTLKEVTYHLRRSSEWMIRLGDGTKEANHKTQEAVNRLWKYTAEFFEYSLADEEMLKLGIGADLAEIKDLFNQKVNEIFYMANLTIPQNDFKVIGGKNGIHSEHLGHILTEMQYLPSKYPEAIW